MKMMPGDMVDALAGEGNHGHIGVEEFTLKRAKRLMETAVDLMSVFPMGYAYRQCVERLALLSGGRGGMFDSCRTLAFDF